MQSVAFAPCIIVVNRWLMARMRQRALVSSDVWQLWHLGLRIAQRNNPSWPPTQASDGLPHRFAPRNDDGANQLSNGPQAGSDPNDGVVT
jgi:hypothetical protein